MSKKNCLFMFILICLFMFVGIDRVEAYDWLGDETLTCLYRKYQSSSDPSVSGWFLLTGSGSEIDVYFNSSSMLYSDNNWKKLEDTGLDLKFNFANEDIGLIDNKRSCPLYVYKYTGELLDGKVHFSTTLPLKNIGPSYVYTPLIASVYASFEDLNTGNEDFDFIGKEAIRNGYTLHETDDGYKSCIFASCSSNSICERIVQIDFNDNDYKVYTNFITDKDWELTTFRVRNLISITDLNSFGGSCPVEIFVADGEDLRITQNAEHRWWISTTTEKRGVGANKIPWVSYPNIRKKGDKTEIVHEGNIIPIVSCSDLLSSDALELIRDAITFVKILIPLALIVFGVADFGMAVFSGKEDDMKKKSTKFGKRVLIAIIIFFVPSLMELLLTLASMVWDFIDPTLCGIFK